jgi:hypothetical protein
MTHCEILVSVWFNLRGREGRNFNEGEGREGEGRGGENFNYLYVWFKRGEVRGGREF